MRKNNVVKDIEIESKQNQANVFNYMPFLTIDGNFLQNQ